MVKPGRGYRRDLETSSGLTAASKHGQRVSRLPHSHKFTAEERARGRDTQRRAGRFGRGRFRGER